jgi:hypothetical protein
MEVVASESIFIGKKNGVFRKIRKYQFYEQFCILQGFAE